MRLKILALILASLTLISCSEPPYTNIDNTQLKALLEQGVVLYDIRRADEWRQTGTVKTSKRLTFVDTGGRLMPNFMPNFLPAVNKNQPVILICRTGNRSGVLARHLIEEMGYTQVYNVRDGISRWIRDGNPVIR